MAMIRFVTHAGGSRIPRHPFMRALTLVGASLAFLFMAMLGAMLFLAALAVIAVVGLALTGRMWWLRRQLRRGVRPQATWHTVDGRVIDGDFRVVKDSEPTRR